MRTDKKRRPRSTRASLTFAGRVERRAAEGRGCIAAEHSTRDVQRPAADEQVTIRGVTTASDMSIAGRALFEDAWKVPPWN